MSSGDSDPLGEPLSELNGSLGRMHKKNHSRIAFTQLHNRRSASETLHTSTRDAPIVPHSRSLSVAASGRKVRLLYRAAAASV